MEQKRPVDLFQEALDYLWNGLGLEEKGWKRLKKGDFKKKMKNGLTYQIWFDRRRYNYIDYEIGHGNVEVGFTCIIKQGDDRLYSFKIEPTTGGSFFQMLTEDLRLNTGLLDTFLPLIQAHYLDFIDHFEVDPAEALQPVCAPFIQPEDYSWCIHVDEQMVERYGTPEQLAEYRRQSELRGTPEHKAKNWMGSMLFHLSHANDVDQASGGRPILSRRAFRMTKKELTDNLIFLSALKMLERLTADGRLSAAEQEAARRELERRLRPTLLFA